MRLRHDGSSGNHTQSNLSDPHCTATQYVMVPRNIVSACDRHTRMLVAQLTQSRDAYLMGVNLRLPRRLQDR